MGGVPGYRKRKDGMAKEQGDPAFILPWGVSRNCGTLRDRHGPSRRNPSRPLWYRGAPFTAIGMRRMHLQRQQDTSMCSTRPPEGAKAPPEAITPRAPTSFFLVHILLLIA